MRNQTASILSAADTASATGGKVDSNQLISASFHFYFDDLTAVGNVKIQVSNDPCAVGNVTSTFTPTNWVDSGVQADVNLGVVQEVLLIPVMSYRWIRAVYTRVSGGSSLVHCNMSAMGM